MGRRISVFPQSDVLYVIRINKIGQPQDNTTPLRQRSVNMLGSFSDNIKWWSSKLGSQESKQGGQPRRDVPAAG